MPTYVKLISKTTNETQCLSEIDKEICEKVLQVPARPKFYGGVLNNPNSFNWFDTIMFQVACNFKTLEEGPDSVRKYYRQSDMWSDELPVIEKIIDYLQANYTAKTWYGR